MAVAFTPPVAPSFPLDDQHTPRINRGMFGDAYTQRSRDGINHDLDKPQLKWENLTEAEAKLIYDFFKDRGGDEAFTYTIPWFTGDGAKTYLCPVYGRNKDTAGNFTITAQWEEVKEA